MFWCCFDLIQTRDLASVNGRDHRCRIRETQAVPLGAAPPRATLPPIMVAIRMRPQPLIVVSDVQASSRWYQELLGATSDHGGPDYERLVIGDQLIMQLHHFEVDHDHGPIADPHDRPYGNGVLLWFETDDFDAVIARGKRLGAKVWKAPHRNPPDGAGGPNHRECWFRDPDGYGVVIASCDGEAGPPDPVKARPRPRSVRKAR
jgi:catechol 2,3-dioxygenase-like lactoylglutathione lyase family enzyme